MTLTEFLLARIAEDEEDLENSKVDDTEWYMPSMWTRERARAECEAKRCIVEHYQLRELTLYRDGGPKYDAGQETMYRMAMRWVLQRLSSPYANHPDYEETWGP